MSCFREVQANGTVHAPPLLTIFAVPASVASVTGLPSGGTTSTTRSEAGSLLSSRGVRLGSSQRCL